MSMRRIARIAMWLALLWLASPALTAHPERQPATKGEEAAKTNPEADKEKQNKEAEPKKKSEPEPKFLRIRRDDKGEPVALETSVVRYVPADDTRPGLSVALIGAVHVGDKGYYDELTKAFTSYDAVL